jgi:hypothetical protein
VKSAKKLMIPTMSTNFRAGEEPRTPGTRGITRASDLADRARPDRAIKSYQAMKLALERVRGR